MKYSIKELRARKDWTQAQAAEKIGVSTTSYNAWERNFGKVKIRDAVKVAKVFDVTLDDIFFKL